MARLGSQQTRSPKPMAHPFKEFNIEKISRFIGEAMQLSILFVMRLEEEMKEETKEEGGGEAEPYGAPEHSYGERVPL